WGNRNWDPYLADTVAEMAAHGVRRAIAFVTSAYGSYSSCRQYLEDIENARARVGAAAPRIDKIRHFFNHSGFIGPFTESTLAAIEALPPAARPGAPLVFTAHSVPDSMAAASGRGAGPRPSWRRRRGWWRGALPPPAAASGRGGSSTRAGAGRRRCRGSARMCATTSPTWPPPARRAPSWSRWASSPTTWRS